MQLWTSLDSDMDTGPHLAASPQGQVQAASPLCSPATRQSTYTATGKVLESLSGQGSVTDKTLGREPNAQEPLGRGPTVDEPLGRGPAYQEPLGREPNAQEPLGRGGLGKYYVGAVGR